MAEYIKQKRNPSSLHLKHNYILQKVNSGIIFLFIMIITVIIAIQSDSVFEVYNEIDVQNQYIYFQDKMEELIDTGVKLIYGYDAYFMTTKEVSTENSEAYLNYLMKDYKEYIRNIGIIKDTTIIYNYPIAENIGTIGVDLAQVETQKDNILKVKNELTQIFQGPVDLIQGGQGYIIRVPILDENNEYWGQASIVLRTDKINERIVEIAEETGLRIVIFQNEDATEPIIGDIAVMDQNPYRFEDISNNGWVIYAINTNEQKSFLFIKWGIYAVGTLFGLLIASYYYNGKMSKFRLEYAIFHDQLTDLYNRRYLEIVQQTITRDAAKNQYGYGILHIDVDNFKYINDNFGHLKGDETLKEISRVLKVISRKDELTFRIGGDEFLVMIPKVQNDHELEMMRNRYEKDFGKEFRTDEELKTLVISIGIAVFPSEGRDFDEVMKKADFDMYVQKKEHKEM